jgi:hypothetical protein
MGWTGCVRCEKFRRDFLARTFVLIALVQLKLRLFSCCNEYSQMHPNTTKPIQTWVKGPMVWTGCIVYENFWRDFMARTFKLIAPVQPKLHRVLCSNETIPNAPKHCETHKNMSLGSNGVDWVRSLRKIPAQVRGTNFCTNCTSSAQSAPSFMH